MHSKNPDDFGNDSFESYAFESHYRQPHNSSENDSNNDSTYMYFPSSTYRSSRNDNFYQVDNPISNSSQSVDLLIICALPEEKDAVLQAFGKSRDGIKTDSTNMGEYRFTHIPFEYEHNNSVYKICIVVLPAMGIAPAACLTTRAIIALNPKIVAMTGICAGRESKTHLGDIIIADQVFDYSEGKKETTGFRPRTQTYTISDIAKNIIRTNIIGNSKLVKDILEAYNNNVDTSFSECQIHLKAIASGASVINDDHTITEASFFQDNLYGIDMEGYGFSCAAHGLDKEWILIKAVQDYADGKKNNTEDKYRNFAMFASAKVLIDLFPHLISNEQ